MAKAKAPTADPKSEPETTEGRGIGDNAPEMDVRQIDAWFTELDDLKKAANEKNGKMRSELKRILDQTGYHEGAFASIRKIHAMSPSARMDFLRTFKPMFDLWFSEVWENEHKDLVDAMADGAVS